MNYMENAAFVLVVLCTLAYLIYQIIDIVRFCKKMRYHERELSHQTNLSLLETAKDHLRFAELLTNKLRDNPHDSITIADWILDELAYANKHVSEYIDKEDSE